MTKSVVAARRMRTPVTIAVAWCGFTACWLVGLAVASSSWGGLTALTLFQIASIGVFIASLAGVVIGIAFLARAQTRSAGVVLFLIGVMPLTLASWAGRAASAARDYHFRQFVVRAQPLVEAIEAYARTNGHPPDGLGDLVPTYLTRVPQTGMRSCPDFFYSKGDSPYDRGQWRLAVTVGATPWDWEMLEHRPSQDYPEHVTRYGGWALIVG
jgi:hypothetical protein